MSIGLTSMSTHHPIHTDPSISDDDNDTYVKAKGARGALASLEVHGMEEPIQLFHH